MSEQISDQQAQELMDVISAKCDEMELEPKQILDGIAKTLLAATVALEVKELSVNIENVGTVEVNAIKTES